MSATLERFSEQEKIRIRCAVTASSPRRQPKWVCFGRIGVKNRDFAQVSNEV